MKRLSGLLAIFCMFLSSEAKLTFQEIRTASNKVIAILYRSDTVILTEVDTTLSLWKINGQPPLSLNRYAMPADKCDHHVYLETDELAEGKEYALKTPYGDTTIVFSDHSILCESIKTNQAAYSGLCKTNFADFTIWLGTGGGKRIQGALPAYEVFEQFTNKKIADGTLKQTASDTANGEFVYRIDLGAVPEGGPYKISLKGYGCSYPFGVGGVFSRKLAYTLFRGQYYQRCGCQIKAPYGLDIRQNPCHTVVYKTNAPIGEASITVGSEPSFECHGGYHDAGDADRRAYHMANPVINLMVYEAFPELFFDGQYNIPDKFDDHYNIVGKGNGIPDIIDEAAWGTLVWEYLQNDDGSIQFGIDTKGYPEPFIAPLDLDTKKYGTQKIDDRPASIGAGLFLHLARVIKQYDSAYSNKLAARAAKSFSYIQSKMAKPEKLYYYIQKYLYDGDSAAHEQVKTLKDAVDSYKDNLFACNGYSINDAKFDNPGYFLSYLVEKNRPIDTAVANYFKAALKKAADVNLAELPKYAFPVGNNPNGTAWGHNVMQPLYSCAPLLYWRFSHEQSYFDGACAMMNYPLGLNPLGLCFVTGLGFDRVHNPHDRESAYTKGKGWGPKPGITIFGPGVIMSIGGSGTLQTLPDIATLPYERKYGDVQDFISTNEFTIFETMSHYALYTVLSNGGTWDEKDDPYAQHVKIAGKAFANKMRAAALRLRVERNVLTIGFTSKSPSRIRGGLYLPNGKKLLAFAANASTTGGGFAVAVNRLPLCAAADGVLICKILTDDQRSFIGKFVVSR